MLITQCFLFLISTSDKYANLASDILKIAKGFGSKRGQISVSVFAFSFSICKHA